ncbi:MAG: DnaJ family domain-containing protein [Chloroflexota bacterium]
MVDKQQEPPEGKPSKPEENKRNTEHKLRMRFDWNNLIEDLIEEGRRQGQFDDLKGKGKPLNLNRNPFSQGNELANNLLKENQSLPVWLTQRNDIRDKTAVLRERISRTWRRFDQEYRFVQDAGARGSLEIAWDDEIKKWEVEIVAINKLVDNYNIKRPVNNLELFKLRLDDELGQVGARRFLRQLG